MAAIATAGCARSTGVTRFEPAMSAGEREVRYGGWREPVDRALYRPPARVGNTAVPRGGER